MDEIKHRIDARVRRKMGAALDRYATARPKALDVEGSDIYADGPIFGDDMKMWCGDEGIITPGDFRSALSGIRGDVTIRLNSPGGSVFDASAIATMIEDRAATDKVSLVVTGMCASAATQFLLACSESSIAKLGMVMIHNAWGLTIGDRNDHMAQASLLEKIDTTYAEAVAELMGEDVKTVLAAMEKETWYSADEAVNSGLVDALYEPGTGTKAETTPRKRMASLISQMQEV